MTQTTALDGLIGLYGDEIFSATDLNRRAGEVLNRARNHPVTISRNNEQFALLRREQAGKLVEAVTVLTNSIEILGLAVSAAKGGEVPTSFKWLREFDSEDLSLMAREIVEAISAAAANNKWETVRDLVVQWERSAIASMDGSLDAALAEEAEESPIPDPATISSQKQGEPVIAGNIGSCRR